MSAQPIYQAPVSISERSYLPYVYASCVNIVIDIDDEPSEVSSLYCVEHGTLVDITLDNVAYEYVGQGQYQPLCSRCLTDRQIADARRERMTSRILTFLRMTMEPWDAFSPDERDEFTSWARPQIERNPIEFLVSQGCRTVRGINTDRLVEKWQAQREVARTAGREQRISKPGYTGMKLDLV